MDEHRVIANYWGDALTSSICTPDGIRCIFANILRLEFCSVLSWLSKYEGQCNVNVACLIDKFTSPRSEPALNAN